MISKKKIDARNAANALAVKEAEDREGAEE